MPDPYAGGGGYNLAVGDALRAGARIIDAASDKRLMLFGIEILLAIAGLHRTTRYRRTRAELDAARACEIRKLPLGRLDEQSRRQRAMKGPEQL